MNDNRPTHLVSEVLKLGSSERVKEKHRKKDWVFSYSERKTFFFLLKMLSQYTVILCSAQSLSCVWLPAIPWTAASQASLSITNSRNLLKLMSIEAVMPSNYLILSPPSPPTFNLSQHQGLFKWVSSLHQVAKLLKFQPQSFQWIFRVDLL